MLPTANWWQPLNERALSAALHAAGVSLMGPEGLSQDAIIPTVYVMSSLG
jgi:hypothetical protein